MLLEELRSVHRHKARIRFPFGNFGRNYQHACQPLNFFPPKPLSLLSFLVSHGKREVLKTNILAHSLRNLHPPATAWFSAPTPRSSSREAARARCSPAARTCRPAIDTSWTAPRRSAARSASPVSGGWTRGLRYATASHGGGRVRLWTRRPHRCWKGALLGLPAGGECVCRFGVEDPSWRDSLRNSSSLDAKLRTVIFWGSYSIVNSECFHVVRGGKEMLLSTLLLAQDERLHLLLKHQTPCNASLSTTQITWTVRLHLIDSRANYKS